MMLLTYKLFDNLPQKFSVFEGVHASYVMMDLVMVCAAATCWLSHGSADGLCCSYSMVVTWFSLCEDIDRYIQVLTSFSYVIITCDIQNLLLWLSSAFKTSIAAFIKYYMILQYKYQKENKKQCCCIFVTGWLITNKTETQHLFFRSLTH